MGYEVKIDRLGNMAVFCETVEDVQELQKALSSNGKTRRRTRAKTTKKDTLSPGMETEAWNFLCENDSEDGVPRKDLVNFIVSLGFKATSESPLVSSLIAKKHAIKLSNGNVRATTP